MTSIASDALASRVTHGTRGPTAPQRVGAVSGAAMLTPKDSFAALGGFDEKYFLHVEDVDLCRRAA